MLQYILRGVCRLNNRPYRVHHPLWNYYTIKMSMSGIINNAFEVNQQTSKCGSQRCNFRPQTSLAGNTIISQGTKYIYWDSVALSACCLLWWTAVYTGLWAVWHLGRESCTVHLICAQTKGKLTSECIFDVLNFPKNQQKKIDKFLP